jgi:N-acetylglucosaminyl-diphospho-decaprenol L-rhamnosyltransferase
MDKTDLTVILVSYNTAELLRIAISRLMAATKHVNTKIVIVDNASKDNSATIVSDEFPECSLIVNKSNVGFGRANNQVVDLATGRYLLLLNTDAFVSEDTIDKTVAFMDEHPRYGILGVKLVGSDGLLQPSARYFPTPWNLFIQRAGLRRFVRRLRMVDDMNWDHNSVRPCDWVPGCYYLVRKNVIDQVGLFDPRYFLYYEEVDHCMAAKKAGWDVVFYPYSTVVHLGGESAKSESEISQSGRQISVLQIESELLFFRKNYGLAAMLAGVALTAVADTLSFFKAMVKGKTRLVINSSWTRTVLTWSLLKKTKFGTLPTR